MQKRYEELIRFCLLFSTLLKQWNWFWMILFHLPAFIEAGERWLTWFLTRWWTSVLWWRGDIGSDLTFETFETLLKPGPGLTLWRRWGGGGLDSDTERCGMLKMLEFILSAPLQQNQSHLSTTWLWFYLWFCSVINFNKCVTKLSYQNWCVLSTTSSLGSVSSFKLTRTKARTQTEQECVLKRLWFCH